MHTAPVLANIESTPLAYAAGAPAEPVTATLTVSSADATTLAGATVSITSGLVASGDVLGFTNQNGITGSYNASTGVLTLSGTASLANYQAALRSVTYRDSNAAATSGTRTISFQVNDGSSANNLSNVVSRTVSVTAAPAGPPVANNDTATTDKNTAINISVLANDTDPAGKTLTVAAVNTTGTKGTVTINSDNTIHYNPNGQFASLTAGQTATDTFTYTATDGTQTSNSATVTVTITGANTAPVISNVETTPLSYQSGSAPVAITSTLTVSDADDATLSGATVAITSGLDSGADTLAFTNQNGITGSYNATTGVLTLTGAASLADYQAALRSVEFSTSDTSASPAARTVSFTVTDSVGATSAAATRTIDVTAAPAGPPVANNDTATTDKNTAINISVLANDTDPAGKTLTVAAVNTTGTKGTVTINSDNTINYNPNGQFASLTAGQTATDTFTYTATDGTQTSNSATVTVTITGANTAPVISNVETTPLSYQSGSAPVAITSTLTVSDADDATLSGATVAITSGLDSGADTLAFTNQNGITGSYNATTGDADTDRRRVAGQLPGGPPLGRVLHHRPLGQPGRPHGLLHRDRLGRGHLRGGNTDDRRDRRRAGAHRDERQLHGGGQHPAGRGHHPGRACRHGQRKRAGE